MSDDFDFTKPQPDMAAASAPFKASGSKFYDAKIAVQVFKQSGTEERFKAEQLIFTEEDGRPKPGSRMYYLVEGEVTLSIAGRPLGTVGPGEVFGEMAVITGRPRSATARAYTSGIAYSMDVAQLQNALGKFPQFGLMLASIMFDRLRFVAQKLASRTLKPGAVAREGTAFDPQVVAQVEAMLPRTAVVRYPRETVIFKEGQSGTFLYLLKEGRIAIAVGSNIVEVIGPGGTFGEMAVIDQSPRTARAGALVDSVLLAIDRSALIEVVKKHPVIAVGLLRGVAERLRHMNAQLN